MGTLYARNYGLKGVIVDKSLSTSFKGRHCKMWRFNIEELCMSTEVNFFKGTGENYIEVHTVLAIRAFKK